MMKYLATALMLLSANVYAVLDPLGCTTVSDAEMRNRGYEPVSAVSGTAYGKDDSTLQAALTTAITQRRTLYLRPGDYRISQELRAKIDGDGENGQNGEREYGLTIMGSYCGTERPTITMEDGVDTRTDEQTITRDGPTAIILMFRDNQNTPNANNPLDPQGGKHYNMEVRNLHLVTGANRGVVGVWIEGAEGSNYSEVSVDATGGFAGFYFLPSSGGYSYNIEVDGGQYGIYDTSWRGGSAPVIGLRLHNQVSRAIAQRSIAPLTIVGADIIAEYGAVVSGLSGSRVNGYTATPILPIGTTGSNEGDSARHHVSIIDSKIEVLNDPDGIVRTAGPSIYLRNVYVKGGTTPVETSYGGVVRETLEVPDTTNWYRIAEFSTNGPYATSYTVAGKQIVGSLTDNNWYNGAATYAPATQILLTGGDQATPPAQMISQHLYRTGLCNPEAQDLFLVSDYNGAGPGGGDDTAGINAAITAAASHGSNRVFMPGGGGQTNVNYYTVTGTINLSANTELCGVSRYATVLETTTWFPGTTSPVIQTTTGSSDSPVIADFKAIVNDSGGSYQKGYDPHVYGIDLQAGNATLRAYYTRSDWGPPGERKMNWIRNNGGGRWYGITQLQPFYPGAAWSSRYTDNPNTVHTNSYYDGAGNLNLGSNGRLLLMENTNNPMTFYSFHCQHHVPTYGAQCELNNADDVTIYGGKFESLSTPAQLADSFRDNNNDPDSDADVHAAVLKIHNSDNVSLFGMEGLGEPFTGRSLIEVTGTSDNVTLVNIGRRNNKNAWSAGTMNQRYFAEDTGSQVHAGGHLALFKDKTGVIPSAPPGGTVLTPGNFTLKVAVPET